MSDLEDLLESLTKDLPANVRKVISTAIENGWTLNPPGMTLALRMNHPTDELAEPVYVVWNVGRTPKGAMSFRFDSAGTKGLVPLKGPDLLEYLQDPTVTYMSDEDIKEWDDKKRDEALDKMPAWDDKQDAPTNLMNRLGAVPIKVERISARELIAEQKQALKAPNPSASGLRVSAPPLRIQPPKV